jgi:hypothetical protein
MASLGFLNEGEGQGSNVARLDRLYHTKRRVGLGEEGEPKPRNDSDWRALTFRHERAVNFMDVVWCSNVGRR